MKRRGRVSVWKRNKKRNLFNKGSFFLVPIASIINCEHVLNVNDSDGKKFINDDRSAHCDLGHKDL